MCYCTIYCPKVNDAQVRWTTSIGGTTVSDLVRGLGLDPSSEEDVYALANGPSLGSGPEPGKHVLGLDWYLGTDLKVSVM